MSDTWAGQGGVGCVQFWPKGPGAVYHPQEEGGGSSIVARLLSNRRA